MPVDTPFYRAAGLPTVVASDPSASWTFGVEGFWGTGADAREYVKCRSVMISRFQMG